MNRDKACLDPGTWLDVCSHGAHLYTGTVPVVYGHADANDPGRVGVVDVYLYHETHPECAEWICLRTGSRKYTRHHMTLDVFWTAADAYPPWHPARDLLLSQGFAP